MIHHIHRVSRHLVFWSLLAVAVGLTGLRLVLPGVDSYKANLAGHVSELLGAPVSIGHLRAKMRGFSPELVLTDITVHSQATALEPVVALREIRLGLDLLETVFSQDLLSSAWVTLVGAKFSVYRKDDGSFAVLGLKSGGGQPDWLWQGRKFEILQSEIDWHGLANKQHPLKLEAVDLVVINRQQQHRINVLAKLPDYYGESFKAAIDFSGNPFVAGAMNGKAFLDAKQLKLGAHLPSDWTSAQGISMNAGLADVQIWSQLEHSHLTAVAGKIGLQQAKLSRQNHGQLAFTSMQTDFRWQQDENTRAWRLDVPHFSLQTSNTQQPSSAAFRFSGQQSAKAGLQKIALFISQFDIQQAVRTWLFFAPQPDEKIAAIAAANPVGDLEKLTLFVNLKDRTAAINGNFKGISFAPFASVPGVENLTGHIKGTDKHGVVALHTHDARIKSPAYFREALVVKSLDGLLDWRQYANFWQLSSRKLNVGLLGLQSESRWQLKLAKHDALPFLDLQMALVCGDVSQMKHYFPVGFMKPADTDWLDRAFVQGQIKKGRLLFVGALGQPLASHVRDDGMAGKHKKTLEAALSPQTGILPPVDAVAVEASEMLGGGLFEASLDVEHLELEYAPGWPRINEINGRLNFLQTRMEASAYEGHNNQLKASKVVVVNPSVGKSKQLLVQGDVDGEIAQALAFLKNTPLRPRIASVADAIATQGNTKVSLDLLLPLAYGVQPKVDGKATLNQAQLTVKALDLPVKRINGLLKFNEHGIYSDTIKAVALNHPVQINIASNSGQTSLRAFGYATLDDIEQQFGLPTANIADGGLDYQLTFRLPLDDMPTDLVVESDLVGVELKLPGTLAKSRDEQQALKIVFGLNDIASMPITVAYRNDLKAVLQFDTAKQRIVAGHILLGTGEAIPQQQAGLKLEINHKQLDLKEGLDWAAAGQGGGLAIREINIHSDQATWGLTPLGRFDLALKPDGKQWSGHINSAFAVGDIQIPASIGPDSTIRLDMASLDLSIIKQLRGRQSGLEPVISPQAMPLLAMSSDKTLWQSLDLGALVFETGRVPDGITIKTLQLDGVAQKLSVSGGWTVKNHQAETELKGHLEMPHAGQLLAQLDITHDLVDTSAAIDFAGKWSGAPQQFSLAGLQGNVDLDFTEGRILSIEPGLGRVLGILAMEQWLKRLQLDFRDLYEEGLTFNSIKGHFTLADGKAVTHDLTVDAIPAKITITGVTDFISKTLDQQASVIPKSADALPIAGTIMDKVTLLVARTLTGDDQDGFLLGSQYQLQGKWDAPQVIPLHDNDGVVPKIWSGLTDFFWLGQTDKQQSK
ncbi:MAG: DUF3971 domain-containing protein [Methylovulum sp.]|uniref:YhdP family phospholipid transporter n=1 Tax=Methylovulum sp. TaxID=1916980 RepID=UPI002608C5BA|nr:DUF3971 domain-containing protein [Methylovulum sp.]MDD2722445.1 DUF3971 domain-containing protein [Methylovulum sp.]MDD5124505.1 DUF3971 domain-containing protein [Methylovulum sp.]